MYLKVLFCMCLFFQVSCFSQVAPYIGGSFVHGNFTNGGVGSTACSVVGTGLSTGGSASGFDEKNIASVACQQVMPAEAPYLGGNFVFGTFSNGLKEVSFCAVVSSGLHTGGIASGFATDSIIRCAPPGPASLVPYIGEGFNYGNTASSGKEVSFCAVVSIGLHTGGIASGFATDSIIRCSPPGPASLIPYIGEGFNYGNTANSQKEISFCAVVSAGLYTGGTASGFATDSIFNFQCELGPDPSPPYYGHIFGFGNNSNNIQVTTACDVVSTGLYTGGTASGFATDSIFNFQCALGPDPSPPYYGFIFGFGNNSSDMESSVACNVVNTGTYSGGIASGFSFYNGICGEFTPSPLPVKLLDFWVKAEKNRVKAQWITATEINNDYFTVEKSFDIANWREIGIVPGAGNSNYEIHYHLYDNHPKIGVQYYRLKQTDFNGDSTYSDIRSVNYISGLDIVAHPNPTKGKVTLELTDGEWTSDAHLLIYTMDGRLIDQKSNLKNSEYIIDLGIYETGVYLIDVYSNGLNKQFKIVKE